MPRTERDWRAVFCAAVVLIPVLAALDVSVAVACQNLHRTQFIAQSRPK
jgi:hypothetical protein